MTEVDDQPNAGPDDLIIRNVVPEDAAAIQALLLELGYEAGLNTVKQRITDFASKEDCLMLIMTLDDQVAGMTLVYKSFSLSSGCCGVIAHLVVTESMRGRGLGRRLVQAAINWTREHNVFTLRVGSQLYRKGAHNFYRSLGFTQYKTQHWFEFNL